MKAIALAVLLAGGLSAQIQLLNPFDNGAVSRVKINNNFTYLDTNKSPTLTFTGPLVKTGNSIACSVATGSVSGCLSSSDWTLFNAKESALTFSAPLVRTVNTISCPTCGGTPGGTSGQIQYNDGAGALGGGDLSGDVTTSGSLVTTLANSGVTPGSCGDTTHSCGVTVNAKGLVTTISNNVIAAPVGAGVPPYSTTTITSSPMTILAATHAQGVYAFVECYDTSTPRVAMECSWTRSTAGDITITYTTAPGQIDIFGSTGATVVSPSPGYSPNQLLSGCGVEYISGLIFNIGNCTYTINGNTYSSPITQITLDAADPTDPRIDLIGVDVTGAVFFTTGTAAMSPAQPSVDPATQLGLVYVNVAAMATTPGGITTTTIYDENTEWTCTASANFNCNSTSNPFRGSKDIEATAAVLTNSATLVKPAAGTEDLTNWNTLIFYIRSKAAWPTGTGGGNAARSVSVSWLNGSTLVGVPVMLRDGVFGFSSSVTSAYQQIAMPISLFGTGTSAVTSLKFTVTGVSGSSSIGFYIDAVSIQGGAGSIVFPTTLMNFKGPWNATATYVPNDVVTSGNTGYVALTANTNIAVSTTATWSRLAPAPGTGTVTSIATTSPITGGTITTTGTIACATCTTNAAALTANQLVIGGGLQATAALGSLGTTTTVLHGNAAGAPTFGAIVNADITNSTIDLTTKVTGILPSGNSQPHSISFVLDGGGSAITTGDKGIYPTTDFACTINRYDISADQSGSITVDIWKAAGAIPTSGDKISASAPMTLSSAQLAQNGSRTGWTNTVSVGDVFGFSVASATTVTRVIGQIWCQ